MNEYDVRQIKELKQFAKELKIQLDKWKNMTEEEKNEDYLKSWRDSNDSI